MGVKPSEVRDATSGCEQAQLAHNGLSRIDRSRGALLHAESESRERVESSYEIPALGWRPYGSLPTDQACALAGRPVYRTGSAARRMMVVLERLSRRACRSCGGLVWPSRLS